MKNQIFLNLFTLFAFLFPVICSSQPPIAGMKLWLRSDIGVFKDASVTPAISNELVQIWADQSGNGNDFAQADTNKRPVLIENALCGKSVLRFTVARRTFLSSLMRIDGPKSIFIVFIVSPFTSAAETLLSLKGNAAEFTEFVATDFAGYNPVTFIADLPSSAGGGFSQNSVGINAGFSAQGNLLAMTYNGGAIANAASYNANYDNIAAPVMSGGLLGRYSDDSTTIGARAPFQNINFLTGSIGEIIVYDRVLSAAEITTVSDYLLYKFGLDNNCVLTLRMQYFNVALEENRVNISWLMADEGNTDKYEIQRSPDGNTWTSIGIIQSAAVAAGVQHTYAAIDYNPMPGWNYYRIVTFNNHNITGYSSIKRVYYDPGHKNKSWLYPNPASDFFFIETPEGETLSVTVFNSLGKTMKKITALPSQEISITDLASGIYFVHIKGSTTNTTLKLIKQ